MRGFETEGTIHRVGAKAASQRGERLMEWAWCCGSESHVLRGHLCPLVREGGGRDWAEGEIEW